MSRAPREAEVWKTSSLLVITVHFTVQYMYTCITLHCNSQSLIMTIYIYIYRFIKFIIDVFSVAARGRGVEDVQGTIKAAMSTMQDGLQDK